MSYLPLSIFNFISLLHLHLLIYSIYFSIHKYIDLLRPYIDPTSPPQFLLFSLHDHHHRHHISIVLPYTTTTFLLFSLHHHHHHHLISIVSLLLIFLKLFSLLLLLLLLLLPLLLISIVFLEKARGQNPALTFEFRLLGVILAPLTFSRENNRNEEEEEKQKNEEEEEGNNRIYMQGKATTRIIFNIVYYLCRTLAIQRQTTRI